MSAIYWAAMKFSCNYVSWFHNVNEIRVPDGMGEIYFWNSKSGASSSKLSNNNNETKIFHSFFLISRLEEVLETHKISGLIAHEPSYDLCMHCYKQIKF